MALTKAQLVDMNSNELILDLDADTSLHSSTDDQIDIKIGGADDFRFTANTFTALAGSGIVIPDGGLTLGSTAVSSTAAELNILDGVTSTATELNIIDGNATVGTTAFADGDGIVTNDNGTMRQTSATTLKTYIADVTLTTAAQTNITSLGTLSALTVDDVAIDGKVITMTGSTDDTFVTTVAANGATSLVTTDTAAAAANLTITADGTVGINSTGDMTLDSSTDIIFDADGGDFSFKDGGTEILKISNSSSDVIIKPIVDTKDIIFQQRDGTEVARIEDNATFNVVTGKLAINGTAITSTAAELNLLDGVSGLVQADLTKLAAVDSTAAELNLVDGITAGTVIASKAIITDSNIDISGGRNITITGELDAATLDISGNADIDGTTNLDAVDIDGAVQLDATLSVGVDDQGYDVKLFGDTASAYMLWDTSADDLILGGAAGLIVPDGQLTLGSTAVTSTAAELNLLDGGTSVGSSITVADADGFVVNDGGTMKTIPATDLKTYAGSAYAPDNWQYFVISANQTMSAGASTTISGWTGGAINGRLIYNFGNQYVSQSSGIFSFSTEGYYRVILRVSGSTAGATDSSGYIFTTTDNSAYGDAVDVNFSKTTGTGFNFYVDTILKITNTTNHKVKTGIYAATNNVTVAGHGGNATRQRTYLRFERLGTAS